MLGSVSSYLVTHAHCSVIVVPPPEHVEAAKATYDALYSSSYKE